MAYNPLNPNGQAVMANSQPVVIASNQTPVSVTGTVAVSNFAGNQSVSGTVGVSIIGQLPGGTAVLGSIATLQGTNPWNVAGSVAAFQAGTQITSLVSTVPSSVIVGVSVFGQLPAGTATLGSIIAYQGTTPWPVVNVGSIISLSIGSIVTVFQSSSLIAINAGSVITIPTGSVVTVFGQSPSIVGTYAEDSGHTNAQKGLFVLGVRNDTVSSFTSSDVDYGPIATDSAGRALIRPFAAEEARVEGYNSVVSTSVTTLIPAAGAGLRNYITDVWIANSGAAATIITFKSQGGGSILGYTIAPAGGGSNLPGLMTPIRTGVNETFDFQATTSSSILFATAKGFKAP